jgi:hypothetical protein
MASSIPNVALGAASAVYANVAGLWDAHALKAGQGWAVGPDRVAYMGTPSATPAYHVPAGAVDLGIATDDFASQVVLLYNDSLSGTVKTAIYPAFGSGGVYETTHGHQEWMKDITDQAAMSAATAAGIAQNLYTQVKQKPGVTSGMTLRVGEILDAGWRPVHPARVALEAWGKTVRVHGVPDMALVLPYTDFVVASASHNHGSREVTVNPVGLAARDPESVLTEIIEGLIKAGILLGDAA